jgi:hypothetical protein
MAPPDEARLAREDVVPQHGERLIVRCDRPGCDHAVLMDPRLTFGGRRNWPQAGRSGRFRCRCGHREAVIVYTRNSSQSDGPVPPAALALWF